MNQSNDPALEDYPHGRGYGHDYMRGGEVLGGYGYAERKEYVRRRGEEGGANSAEGTEGTEGTKGPENSDAPARDAQDVRHQAH